MSYISDFEPDGQEYARIESFYKTRWGNDVSPEWIVLGWAEKEEDKIRMRLPSPEDEGAIIIGERGGKWKRESIPFFWTQEYIDATAEERFSHIPKAQRRDWWKENATDEMEDYANRQWDMRWKGVFVWINQRLTWLPGTYWMWLQWVKVDGSYPQYLDVQLRLSYVLNWSQEDRKNYGIIWLKRRRIGGSYFLMWECLDYVMKYKNTFAGLQGNTEKEIQKDFERKMVPMWRNLPLFFRTENDGTDNPKTGFRFKSPAKGGQRKFGDGDMGNESYVETAATKSSGKETFDREKLHRWFRDEWAKTQADVYGAFLEIKRTMESMGRIIGRALMPSTAGEASNENVKRSEALFFESMLSQRIESGGTTVSGLISYFTPAYDSLFIEDISFIGPYGEGVIGKPTKEQYDYLVSTWPENKEHYDLGGSWHWLKRKFGSMNPRAQAAFKRQYPSSPRDAFKPESGSAHINPVKVGDCMDRLTASQNNVPYHKKLIVRCRIEPIGADPGTDSARKILTSKMELVLDPDGPWYVRSDFFYSKGNDWKPNNINTYPSFRDSVTGFEFDIMPDGERFSIGVDPIDKDLNAVSTSSGLSKMAMTVIWKYNTSIDAGKAAGQQRTYAPVMHYLFREESQKTMYLELAKLIVLLGSKAHIENTRGAMCMEWLSQHGFSPMILTRPMNTFSPEARAAGRVKLVPGTPASDDLYHMGIHDYVNEWVTKWASPENCPFMDIWDDFKNVDPKYMQPYDSFVSFMFALFDAAGGVVSDADKNAYLGGSESGLEQRLEWQPSGHSVNKYRIRK